MSRVTLVDANGIPIIANANESLPITTVLSDASGDPIAKASILTLTLKLVDATGETVLNSRNDQDILDANGGTVAADGTVTLKLAPSDNAFVSTSIDRGDTEVHYALFSWTWTDPDAVVLTGKHEIEFQVRRAYASFSVESVIYNDSDVTIPDNVPRSAIREMTVTLSDVVGLVDADVEIYQRDGGGLVGIDTVNFATVASKTVITITFNGGAHTDATYDVASLENGNYELRILGSVMFGGVAADDFFRIIGDVDGSGLADATDQALWVSLLGTSRGVGGYRGDYDFNNDNFINSGNVLPFATGVAFGPRDVSGY